MINKHHHHLVEEVHPAYTWLFVGDGQQYDAAEGSNDVGPLCDGKNGFSNLSVKVAAFFNVLGRLCKVCPSNGKEESPVKDVEKLARVASVVEHGVFEAVPRFHVLL